MLTGVWQSLQLINRLRPQACFVTGGYVCVPVTVACWIRGVPVLIYLPDMTPGLAVRCLSQLAQRVAVSFPEVADFFGKKAVVTGYPVREDLLQAIVDKTKARQVLAQKLGIRWVQSTSDGSELPLVLVFGGSQGARSINRAIWNAAPSLLPICQILHIIGTRDWFLLEEEGPNLPEPLARRYHPVTYLHDEMAWALASADLAVARAGASVLAEFPIAHLPSVLVPLPIANSHQMQNVQKLVNQNGAVVIEDDHLADQLEPTVLALLTDENRRLAMGAAVGTLARPQAAQNIAQQLCTLVGPTEIGV